MGLKTGKRLAVTLSACIAMSMGVVAPAQAGLLGSLGGVVSTTTTNLSNTTNSLLTPVLGTTTTQAVNVIPAGYDPLTPFEQLLGLQAGLPTVLQQLLCPPVTQVAQLLSLNPSLNPIADGLTSLTCSIGILDYKFLTRWQRPDGSIVERTTTATIGVPTILNVDDDAAGDLIGTFTLTGNNSIGVIVDRAIGETSTLPVSVEAILNDPNGSLFGGRQHIAVGYDARADKAPQRFVLSTPVNTILAPSSFN